jgi:phospholipid/cholesterol/gamma-HCH transport system substrate-binding protein
VSPRRLAAPLALIAVLIAAALLAGVGTGGGSGRELTAVFAGAHGLVPGGRVLAGGVRVGDVTDVRIGADGLPHVRMRVTPALRLRRGARADLRLRSNSGELNRVVELTTGRGPVLPDGAVIPLARTSSPVELDDALGTLDPAMRRDLRGVLAGLDGATSGLAPAYRTALRHSAGALTEAGALLGGVTRDGAALRTLVSQGQVATAALARSRGALGQTVQELSGLLRTTGARGDDVRAAVRALPAGLREPRAALEDVRAAVPTLRRLVRAAEPASRELRPTGELLAPTLRTAAPAVAAVATLLEHAGPGLRSLRPLLTASRATLADLGPALTDALPALDTLRVYAPELMGFLSGWSGAASSYDAAGHAVRLLPAEAPIPNTERPASSIEPGYIASPYLRVPGTLVGHPWTDYRSSFLSRQAP